jgi:probable HAF family extracellular repeat protein
MRIPSLFAAACIAVATAATAAPQSRWSVVVVPPIYPNGGDMALGINNRGQVVGSSTVPDPVQVTAVHGFVWDNGTMIDMGRAPTGFPLSSARAINDSGTVLAGDGLGNSVHVERRRLDAAAIPGPTARTSIASTRSAGPTTRARRARIHLSRRRLHRRGNAGRAVQRGHGHQRQGRGRRQVPHQRVPIPPYVYETA